jgi:hypothetical protein
MCGQPLELALLHAPPPHLPTSTPHTSRPRSIPQVLLDAFGRPQGDGILMQLYISAANTLFLFVAISTAYGMVRACMREPWEAVKGVVCGFGGTGGGSSSEVVCSDRISWLPPSSVLHANVAPGCHSTPTAAITSPSPAALRGPAGLVRRGSDAAAAVGGGCGRHSDARRRLGLVTHRQVAVTSPHRIICGWKPSCFSKTSIVKHSCGNTHCQGGRGAMFSCCHLK